MSLGVKFRCILLSLGRSGTIRHGKGTAVASHECWRPSSQRDDRNGEIHRVEIGVPAYMQLSLLARVTPRELGAARHGVVHIAFLFTARTDVVAKCVRISSREICDSNTWTAVAGARAPCQNDRPSGGARREQGGPSASRFHPAPPASTDVIDGNRVFAYSLSAYAITTQSHTILIVRDRGNFT